MFKFKYSVCLLPFSSPTNTNLSPLSRKLIVFLIFLVLQVLNVISIFGQLNSTSANYETCFIIVMEFLSHITCLTILMTPNFLNQNAWKDFLQNMQDIELFISEKTKVKPKSINMHASYMELLAICAGELVLAGWQSYTFFKFLPDELNNLFSIFLNNVYMVNHYFSVLMTLFELFLLTKILVFINARYESFNKNVDQIVRHFIFEDKNQEVILMALKDCRRNLLKLYKLVKQFNDIFGWFIFWYLSYLTIALFFGFYMMLYQLLPLPIFLIYILHMAVHQV